MSQPKWKTKELKSFKNKWINIFNFLLIWGLYNDKFISLDSFNIFPCKFPKFYLCWLHLDTEVRFSVIYLQWFHDIFLEKKYPVPRQLLYTHSKDYFSLLCFTLQYWISSIVSLSNYSYVRFFNSPLFILPL